MKLKYFFIALVAMVACFSEAFAQQVITVSNAEELKQALKEAGAAPQARQAAQGSRATLPLLSIELSEDYDDASVLPINSYLELASEVKLLLNGHVVNGDVTLAAGNLSIVDATGTGAWIGCITVNSGATLAAGSGSIIAGESGVAVINSGTLSTDGGAVIGKITNTGSMEGVATYNTALVAKATVAQAALNAAIDGQAIQFAGDIEGDLTAVQKPNTKITIDGASKTLKGTIIVDGKSSAYATTGVTIKNLNFDATGISKEASINLGDGTNATRYTSNVTIDACSFKNGGDTKAAVKSYTGGCKNLVITNCTAEGMHSLLQAVNITGITITGCTATTKNGINLNSSSNVKIENNTINVKGYAVRAGVTGGTSGKIELTNNTLTTDNTEGDPVIVLRGTAPDQVDLKMSKNSVSGNVHISGTTANTKISAEANYWDGKEQPVVAEGSTPVVVNSYYTDAARTTLERNEMGSVNAFVSADRITGDVTHNAVESLVIQILGADNNIIGTSTLENDTYRDGTKRSLTWRINLGADDSGSWAMNWETGAPSIDNMPAKVKVLVDGVEVGENTIKFTQNGDGQNPVFAAKTDAADGKILSFIVSEGFGFSKAAATLVSSAAEGDNIVILEGGIYTVPTGKNLTITGKVEEEDEDVTFDNIGACNMGGASVTFNNVTFDYYPNVNYTGLQHSGNLVYNNCTINGQVFLYGASETFNECTFNQNSSDAYNVWTYGAKEVAFNDCTFNSAGKSVLIYAEGASIFNNVTVTGCTFNASTAVDGKAAIEMDSSLTGGINLTIDATTTANNFGTGNVSGNSLWNNKKGNDNNANNDITVTVDGDKVLDPKYEAKIGETGHRTLQEALAAATEGQTITMLDDVTPALTSQRAITKAAIIDLGGKTMTLTEDDLYFGTTTFKNGTIVVDPSVKPSTAVFWMFANQTLTFDNVKIVATGVTGTYLIGLDGNNSDLNLLNGSEIVVENTTALDLDIICVNASTGNDIKVENSKVNVTNLDGRVFFRGNYTVKDSEVNLEGITKAGFRIEAGQTLSIEGTSVVNITGELRDGGIHLTDLTAIYTKAETATVNATVNEPKVAKVGENTYRTLALAVAAVEDGGTITLIANETFTTNNRYDNGGYWDGLGYSGDKSFTIDLANFTISQDGALNDYLMWFKNDGAKANTITLKNGTLDAGTTAYSALATSSSNAQKITVNLENINVINNNSNGAALKIRGGSELNVKAGTIITGQNSYLGIEAVGKTTVVNIYEGAEIYQNGTSSYCGCLAGASGNSTINVYGGKGQSKSGGFIAMTSGGTINIEGGEWTANTDGTYANGNKSVLVAQSDKQYNAGAGNSIVNVTGGTFKGGYNCYGNAAGDAQINISGGNFNSNPSAYVKAGYVATESAGIYTVVEAPAYIEGKASYVSLADAYEAAVDGDVIVLNESVTTFPVIKKAVTFKGGKENAAVEINVFLAQNFTAINGTVKFENLTFNKPLFTEQGGTKPGLTIEFEGCNFNVPSDEGYAILIGTSWSNSVVKGLKVNECNFKYVGDVFKGGYMLYVQCVNEVSITNNTIDGNNLYRGAIHLGDATEHATVATVSNNTIKNFCRGVMMGNRVAGSSATISGNTFDNINYSDKDSKPAQECAPIFIHSNATAEALKIALKNNAVTNCTNPMIYSEDTDLIKYYVTEFTGNTVDGTAIELTNSYNAPNQVFPVATINDAEYFTLQAAVNAVKNGETIILVKDITENVTLTEKKDLYYTIDGAGKTMKGTFTSKALSDTNDNRRITIKNIKFVDDSDANVDFISSAETNHYPRLTVEGCTFTGSGNNGDVAIRLKSSHSVVIKDCTGTGLHSFLQNTSGWNLTIENVTVTNSKSGLALGTVQGVTVKGSNIVVPGYGIRLDANTYNNNAVIESNTVDAFIPVVVRNVNTESNITFNGTNTMKATNTDGIWCAIGTSEYEENGKLPTAPAGNVMVTLNDTGLSEEGIYGNYYDELTIHVASQTATTSLTREIYVATMDEAVAEAKTFNAGTVIYKVYGAVELTTAFSHGILDLGKNVVIEGVDPAAKLTIVGGGVPDIKGVTFKNITLADEGTYLPTANEFMYQNYIDCTFENVKFVDGIRLSGTSVVKDCEVDANTTNEYAIWLDEGEFTMTGTTVVGGADAYGLIKSDVVSKITITGNTFQYLGEANKEALNTKGAVIIAENNTFIDCAAGILPADKTNYADDSKTTVLTDADIAENNTVTVYYAAIGEQKYETLLAAIKAAQEGETITLIRDVTMDYNARDAYDTQAQNVVINGNGKTLTLNQKNSDWASIGLANNSKLVLNNMTIEKTGYGDTSGAWNTHAIIFTCPVEMNDVTVNNSVAVQAGATLNNVTINEANGYYGLWINGNGQAVEVKGGSITATNGGRGIKIADEYVDAPAQVTLSVDGTVFTTAKKAAVLVSSKGGANITASNVNIENVAEDKVNFVWVDEDWAQYFDQVEVTGATVRPEGGEGSFAAAIYVDGAVQSYFKTFAKALETVANGQTITLIKDVAEDVTIKQVVGKNITIDGNSKTYTGTITVQGDGTGNANNKETLTFKNINFDITGAKYAITSIKGSYSRNITVENCTFKGENSYGIRVRNGYNYTLKNVTVDGFYSFFNATESLGGLTVENVTVTNTGSAFNFSYGTGIASLKNVNVDVTGNGIWFMNRNASTITLENCSIKAETPVAIKEAVTNTNNFVFNGTNNFSATNANGNWLTIEDDSTKNATFKVVANDTALDFTKTSGLIAYAKNTERSFAYNNNLTKMVNETVTGDVVTLLADVTMDTKTFTTQNDGYAVLLNVAEKAVTLDLNGKKVAVNAAAADLADAKSSMLLAVFSADLGGDFTIIDSEGNGAVEVAVNDAKVYSVFASESAQSDKSNNGKLTVNSGSFTTVGKVSNAMFFSDADEVITINGGTFFCDGASNTSGYPWFVNTLGNNELQVVVNGGTFNTDINHQYRPFEVFVPETLAVKSNDNGTWTIVPAQAYVTEMLSGVVNEAGSYAHKVGYATIAEAYAATNNLGKTVTILAGDYTMDFAANKKDVTLQGEVDENGNNLVNITGRIVASTGATIKNLNIKNEKKGDYDCALCVSGKDITIDGVNLSGYNTMRYCYATGNVTVKNSVIEGSNFAVHFDGNAGGVIAFENSTITGWCSYASTIESVSYTNCILNKGNYSGHRYYNKNITFNECTFGDGIKIDLQTKPANVGFTSTTMTIEEVKALFKDAYTITSNNITLNGTQVTYAVSAQGKYYATLQEAIDDMPAGTATYWAYLKSNNVLTAPVTVPAGVKVVINLNGFDITYTSDVAGQAMITNNGELGIEGDGKVVYTYTGVADAAYTKGNYTIANRGKLTIDGGTIENATAAMKHASYAIDNEGNAELVINDGKVINTNNYAVRQFASGNNENNITVNGGEISGTRAVWMQAAGSNTADAPAITLNVTGGKLIGTGETGYTLAVYSYNYGNSLDNVAINIEGGEIVGDIALTGGKNKTVAETVEITGGTITDIYSYADDAVAEKSINISGGEFLNVIDETYLALGYQLTGDAAPYAVQYTGKRAELALVDGEFTEFVNEKEVTVGTLTYKRNILKTWVPIYVPFEIPVSMLADKFNVARINDVRRTDSNNDGELDDFDMEIIFIHGGNADGSAKTLKANYPYFIKSKSGQTETMEITLTDATLYAAKENVFDCTTMTEKFEIKGNCRLMQANEFDPKNQYTVLTTGEWGHTTSALKPFRFYMTKSSRYEDEPSAPMNSMRITVRGEEDENGATIIYDVVEDSLNNNGNDFIYDLQGRRVSEPKKGGIYIKNGKKILY